MTPLELLDETISIRVRKNDACSKGCWMHIVLSDHFTVMFRNIAVSRLSVFLGVRFLFSTSRLSNGRI